MPKIKSIETFAQQAVTFVRVRTEDGAEGWGQTSTFNADITAMEFHDMAGDGKAQAQALVVMQDIPDRKFIKNTINPIRWNAFALIRYTHPAALIIRI